MAAINVQGVTKQFGAQIVLRDATAEVHAGETVGLVGVNGAGKTTLFRLMAKELEPDLGTVTWARSIDVGHLKQDHDVRSGRTLHEEVGSVFADLLVLEKKLHDLSDRIAADHDEPSLPELLASYDRVNAQFIAAGGHTFEARLAEILGGLGFTKEDHDRPTSVLSGGQRCRAALAKLLLEDKPLLLLDEPTNHLDIDAVRWLEKFLTAHQGGAVVISHDRYLLDRLCQRIIEVERGQASSFPGNYTNYAQTKARRALTQERQFEKDQAFISKERAYIAKHRAGQRSQQAKGRRTRLNRQLADGELVTESVGKQQSAKISFQTRDTRGPSETEILRCDDLAVGFDGKPLFAGLSLQVRAGERFCVTGPNGTGKTSMLRVLMGELPPMTGTFSFSPRVRIGYYAQSPAAMEPARSIVDEIRLACTHLGEHEARSYLARFLFRGNDVFKPLGALSGGEQSRVRLATLILQRPDVLVLDEPTNHLDIPSREVLEEALHEFPGAIIAVSHDRYFLDQVAERLLVMRPEGHRVYDGNYSFYLRELETAQEAASVRPARRPSAPRSTKAARPKKGSDKNSAVRKKKGPSPFDRHSVEKIEAIIIEKETKLAELQARFGDPAVCRDPEALEELQEEIDAVAAELAEADAAWHERID